MTTNSSGTSSTLLMEELVERCRGHATLRHLGDDGVRSIVTILLEEQFAAGRRGAHLALSRKLEEMVEALDEEERDAD